MKSPGVFQNRLVRREIPRGPWDCIEVPWRPSNSFGVSWVPWGPCGPFSGSLESLSVPWNLLGSEGVPWNPEKS